MCLISHDYSEFKGCWEKGHKGKGAIFITSYQRYIVSTSLTTIDINLDQAKVICMVFPL